MLTTRLRLGAASLVVLGLVACGHPTDKPATTASTPTRPPSPVAASSASKPPLDPAQIADCSWGAEASPTHFSVPARGIDEPMVSVGLDASGNVGAPPENQRNSVAWWNGGPQAGTDRGHVILTAHTWYGDVATGNVLADPAKGLKPGDVIKVSDGTKTVCYQYTHMQVIDVATYDPNSDVWINNSGDPQLTIMICWDYDTKTQEWKSRHVFFADPIKK